jgi:hypothetical protein
MLKNFGRIPYVYGERKCTHVSARVQLCVWAGTPPTQWFMGNARVARGTGISRLAAAPAPTQGAITDARVARGTRDSRVWARLASTQWVINDPQVARGTGVSHVWTETGYSYV